jgi:hypothetical protein
MIFTFRPFLMPIFSGAEFRAALLATSMAFAVTAAGAQQPAGANTSFIARYQARVTTTQAEQPHWITPLVTVTPRLEQEFRADFVRQTNAAPNTTWIYGNGKGLEVIPARRIELLFNLPPFFNRNAPNAKDGFGDVSLLAKGRIFSRNEEHGNAILTAFVGASVPTGKNGNGSCCAVITPTLAGGKGFGPVALTSTLGGTLPVSNEKRLGHTILWNNAVQYHVAKTGVGRFFWPEAEFNSSFYSGGSNDGKIATYATPGVVVGRIPLTHDALDRPGRLGLTFGAGEQIALTHFHSYSHALVLTARIPF